MRTVIGNRHKDAAQSAGEPTATPGTSATREARMHRPGEFYRLLGERLFSDATKPVDMATLVGVLGMQRFRDMTARTRDEDVRKVVTTPGATIAPERVFRAWAGLLVDDLERQENAPADVDSAFNEALDWGERVLLDLRRERPIVYRNTLQTTTDFIGEVGTYEPDVVLAREFAKRGELGGSAVLTETLERCPVPSDIHRALGAQVVTFPKVPSLVPQAPAALVQARLDDLGIIDAVMASDAGYAAEILRVRQSLGLKRSTTGFQLNLRDQVDGPLELGETFGRLASQLTTSVDATTRELIVTLARLQSSPEITTSVKKVALLQFDAHLRRLAKQGAAAGTQAPTFTSLAQALLATRKVFDAELAKAVSSRIDPTLPRLLRDSVDALSATVFKVTGDPHFAAEHMTAARDPGAILLRKVLDAPVRETLVSAALAQSATPAARAAQIALISDKAKRDSELAKLIAANRGFCPSPETAALLLSWPTDVPRPNSEEAAKAERGQQLAALGAIKPAHLSALTALIDQGASENKVVHELLCLGGNVQFHIGVDDAKIDPALGKIIRGEAKPDKGGLFSSDTLTPLMESPAIAALPAQMKAGANEDFVRKSLIRAIRSQNGQVIEAEKGVRALLKHPDPASRIKLQTVFDALDHIDPTVDYSLPGRTLSAVDVEANILFAYRVLLECYIGLGYAEPGAPHDATSDAIYDAGRRLTKRTGIPCLMPYASSSLQDNLDMLTKKPPVGVRPDSAHFLALLDRLDLPETVLTSIAARDDLDQFPPQTLYELFARAVEDKSVPVETVATLAIAATTLRIPGSTELYATNLWSALNDLATRKYGAKLGSMILAGVSAKTHVDTFYRAAANLAAEGKLFDANEVAKAVLERDPASSRELVMELGTQAPKFFDALSLESRQKLIARVLKELTSASDASATDLASACFTRVAELGAAGQTLGADVAASLETVVLNALTRLARNPIESAALGQLLPDAAKCGVDIAKIVKTVMTDPKSAPALTLTPAQLMALRLDLARLVPTSDASDLKASISAAQLEAGPYMAAFDLIEQRALPKDVLQLICRSAITWAADQKAFGRVVGIRNRLADAGYQDRLAIFDTALDSAMKDKPDMWSAVPEVRGLLARSKLEELRPAIRELAAGGDAVGDLASAMAERIATAGPYAAELVPEVLSALRREVRALRPSLDDINLALQVPTDPQQPKVAATAPVPTKDFHGVELALFQGDTTHGRVPDALPFTATQTGLRNLEKLEKARRSKKPFVVVLGDPGVSKSYTARVLAYETGSPIVELDGGPGRRADEAAGRWGRGKTAMPAFARSEELEIYTKGGIIVDDEFQLSSKAILQMRAEQAARFDKDLIVRTKETEVVTRHPQTQIFCIGNYTEIEIPEAIRANAVFVHFDPLTIEDQVAIAQTKAPTLAEDDLKLLGTMQRDVEIKFGQSRAARSIALSVRNLTRAAKRAEQFRGEPEIAAARAARESYLDGITNPELKAEIVKSFKEIFGVTPEETLPDAANITLKQGPRSISIGEATVSHGRNKPVDPTKVTLTVGGRAVPYILGDRERIQLEALAKAMQMQESVLYVAPQGCGVVAGVEAMAQLTGLDLFAKDLNNQTSITELFGCSILDSPDGKTFETRHAPGLINLLNQANKGGIVLIQNIDRLSDDVRGELHRMLAERKIPGDGGKLVDMHPNLHIVMTTSPATHHQLSLPFQNRVTQQFLTPTTEAEVLERLTAIGEKLKVPAIVVQDMVRYQSMWTQLCGTLVARNVQKFNLPRADMARLLTWLGELSEAANGTTGTSGDPALRVRNAFIDGGLTHFGVKNSVDFDVNGALRKADMEILEEILTAMADGDDAKVQKITGIKY